MGILGLSAIYNVATGLMDAGQSQENVIEAGLSHMSNIGNPTTAPTRTFG